MLNLKGIWLPIEVLIDKNLSDKEKFIYAIILFLSKENNYCYCTNTTLSKIFYISTTQISKLINSLKNKKYIKVEIIFKENTKQIEKRKLIPMKNKKDTYIREVKYISTQKLQYPIQQKLKDNKYNNKINSKSIEGRDYSNINLEFLYVDCLYCYVKEELTSVKKAVYVMLGIDTEGKKEVIGIWLDKTESSTFWNEIFEEIKSRGVKDIFFVSMEGLKGLPEAIEKIYPKTITQRCVVHIMRNIYALLNKKEAAPIIKDFKKVYTSANR